MDPVRAGTRREGPQRTILGFTDPRRAGSEEVSREVSSLNQQEMNWFKDLLHSRRQELLGEAGRTVSGMVDGKENFPEPADRAIERARRMTIRRFASAADADREVRDRADSSRGSRLTWKLSETSGPARRASARAKPRARLRAGGASVRS